MWGSAVQAFLVQQSMQPFSEQVAVVASATVIAAQSQNHAAGASASSSRTPSRAGGADAHLFPVAVYIRWRAKHNVRRPCTLSKLGSVMRIVFGADHVAHVADHYLKAWLAGL